MTDFLVAALQITSTSNVEANFAEAEEQIELASRRGAELIGLPENFAFLGEDVEKLRLASELSVKCANFLKTMSQRYQVILLGGGYPVPAGDDSHTFNRSALFGKDGQILKCLKTATHGKRLTSLGDYEDDFKCCSELDSLDIVPAQVERGVIRAS